MYDLNLNNVIFSNIKEDSKIKYIENNEEKENTLDYIFNECSNYQLWKNENTFSVWSPDIKILFFNFKTKENEYLNFNSIAKNSNTENKCKIKFQDGSEIILKKKFNKKPLKEIEQNKDITHCLLTF